MSDPHREEAVETWQGHGGWLLGNPQMTQPPAVVLHTTRGPVYLEA